MGKALDLKGQVFKTWEVIEKLPSRKGKVYWLCKCQKCGQYKEVQTNHLVKLTVGSCNCNSTNNNTKLGSRICEICGKSFIPMDKAYSRKYCYECSPHEDENCSHAQAVTIKRRAIKKALIAYKGGKCERCGYNKCNRALEFHHLDPSIKDFGISKQINRNIDDGNEIKINVTKNNKKTITVPKSTIEKLSRPIETPVPKEVDKCILVCSNCHAEIHDELFNQGFSQFDSDI